MKVNLLALLESVPLHPFLTAYLFVLLAYQQVYNSVVPDETVPAFVFMQTLTLVVFLVTLSVLRNLVKAGLVTSFFLVTFILFAAIDLTMQAMSIQFFRQLSPGWQPLLVWLLIFSLGAWFICKSPLTLGKHTFEIPYIKISASLNMTLLLLAVVNTGITASAANTLLQKNDSILQAVHQPFDKVSLDPQSPRPDIYYFILDSLPHPKTLKKLGADPAPFTRFLESKGFLLIPESASNFDRTIFSVSSTLNMEYITDFTTDTSQDLLYWELIRDNNLFRLLRKDGYKLINVSSGSNATYQIPNAVNLRCNENTYFLIACLQVTPMTALEQYFPLMRNLWAESHLCPVNHLSAIAKMPGPKFVLVHSQMFHAPIIFKAGGGYFPLSSKLALEEASASAYAENFSVGSKQVEQWLDQVLSNSPTPPVVIVQSDHGTKLTYSKVDFLTYAQERMRVFNAVYMPGHDLTGWRQQTLVNTYRLVLNELFRTNLPLLKDKSMLYKDWDNMTGLTDVHKDLKF